MLDSLGRFIRRHIRAIIIVQSLVICCWFLINSLAGAPHWDEYPFIFLNLSLSLQAAYTGPLLLLSDELDQAERDATMQEVRSINRKQTEILEVIAPLIFKEEEQLIDLETRVE